MQAGSKAHADNLSRRVSARKRIPQPLTLRRLALNCLIDLQGGSYVALQIMSASPKRMKKRTRLALNCLIDLQGGSYVALQIMSGE